MALIGSSESPKDKWTSRSRLSNFVSVPSTDIGVDLRKFVALDTGYFTFGLNPRGTSSIRNHSIRYTHIYPCSGAGFHRLDHDFRKGVGQMGAEDGDSWSDRWHGAPLGGPLQCESRRPE